MPIHADFRFIRAYTRPNHFIVIAVVDMAPD